MIFSAHLLYIKKSRDIVLLCLLYSYGWLWMTWN